MGTKPSFVWRSIQGASKVVSDGLIWRIGVGSNVWIWGDIWLNNPSTYMVQSPPKVLDAATKVEELIDQNGKGWNLTFLQEIFNMEERVAIQSVPFSCTNQPDKLVRIGVSMRLVDFANRQRLAVNRTVSGQWNR